jgi:hypothetical protein
MTTQVNESKAKHDAIQREIAAFEQGKATMIDLMVHNTVALGTTSIERVAAKLRIPKDKLINSLTAGLFRISGDNIANKV